MNDNDTASWRRNGDGWQLYAHGEGTVVAEVIPNMEEPGLWLSVINRNHPGEGWQAVDCVTREGALHAVSLWWTEFRFGKIVREETPVGFWPLFLLSVELGAVLAIGIELVHTFDLLLQ